MTHNAGTSGAEVDINLSISSMILDTDPVAQIVMLILLMMSVYSWTIIISKYRDFNKIEKQMRGFEDRFWSGVTLDHLYENIKRSQEVNPLIGAFIAAMGEFKKTDKKSMDSYAKTGLKERIVKSMSLVKNKEMVKFDTSLSTIATIGSNAPFVGLFGMVWSIINSFQALASTKNVAISTLAPRISEALFVTAIGLLVAVPAIVFYNALVSKSNVLTNKMEDFSDELENLLSRAIDDNQM